MENILCQGQVVAVQGRVVAVAAAAAQTMRTLSA